MRKSDRYNNLIIQAQRKIKEVTLNFGSQFASYYRRRIENLCQEIDHSLEQNDERTLERIAADLQDVLYELNREVRLQYDDREDDLFWDKFTMDFTVDSEQLLTARQKNRKEIVETEQIEKRDRYNNLIIQAQRRIKQVILNFDDDWFENYCRRIDGLCQKILDSLQQDSQDILDTAEAELKNTLNELEQEVRQRSDD